MKTIQHLSPSLGAELTAEEDTEAELAYFRGIPYASVSKRWTQSVVQNSLPSSFDATTFGPKCPQPAHVSMITVSVEAPTVAVDEFACLNLDITVPKNVLPQPGEKDPSSLLPVMVWIHGGAFKNGSNSDPRYRPNALSSLAKQAGQPFILVQINYRLGVFGFSASSDLATEYSSDPVSTSESSDYFANFGMVDQCNAFKWVQNHIKDFGGDPSNVTAVGVSAGSASIHLHILSGNPLFDRAILMSGSAPAMGPLPIQFSEAGWLRFCKTSGVIDDSSEARLEHLRSLSAEEAVKNGPNATLPFADGKLLPKTWRLGDPNPVSRCKNIIIGTTNVEAIIFDGLSRLLPQKYMHAKIADAFSPTDAAIFCKYFGFSLLEEQTNEAYRDAIRSFLSTIMFHYPSLRIAETYEGNASLYNFEEHSPFEGPAYGMSVHGQCAVYLFGNGRETWPKPAQKVSLEMAKVWIDFVYGKQPWERYPENQKFMRFGPHGESGLKGFGDDEARSYEYLPWLREHFDETMKVVLSLMS